MDFVHVESLIVEEEHLLTVIKETRINKDIKSMKLLQMALENHH
jgi:hypothetical protein